MTPVEFGILIAAVIAAVVLYMILFVPCGPHQDECEHGNEPEWCPDCQGFGGCYSAPSSTGTMPFVGCELVDQTEEEESNG